jgi:hypothetical protein
MLIHFSKKLVSYDHTITTYHQFVLYFGLKYHKHDSCRVKIPKYFSVSHCVCVRETVCNHSE